MGKRRLPQEERLPLDDDEDDDAQQPQQRALKAMTPMSSASTSITSTTASGAENRAERRRRQCRISQRRYRDKKGSMEYNLRLDINELRESVDRLQQARVVLETKIQNDRRLLQQSVLKAVEQYYVMFKHGLHDPEAGEHVQKCYDIQIGFLAAFMDPNVQMGNVRGIDVIVEQWRRYSRYHSSLLCELIETHVIGSDTGSPIVKATGRLVVTLNRTTLEELFPQTLKNDARLAESLIGRQVEYTTCTEYMFNERVQVIRQDLTVDFVSGFSAVLGDPIAASNLFREAQIVDHSLIGRLDSITLDAAPIQDENDDGNDQSGSGGDVTDDSPTLAPQASTPTGSRLGLHFIMS